MKKIIKYFSFYSFLLAATLMGCDSKKSKLPSGEVEDIEITFPKEGLVAMSKSEYIEFDPKIVSTTDGEITDTKDYEFYCSIQYRHLNEETDKWDYWLDVNPELTKKVRFFADFPAGDYPMVYKVVNTNTGVTYSAKTYAKILTSTYEGWMVLSEEGADKKARLQIISLDSKKNEKVSGNLLGADAPAITGPTAITLLPSRMNLGEAIYLMSYSEAYRLDLNELTASSKNNIKMIDFILPTTPGAPLSMLPIYNKSLQGPTSRLCVTDLGNAYAITSNTSGAAFEYPLNTDGRGNDPTYKVSHMTGTSMARPGNSSCALLYDIDNKRFMGWNYDDKDKHTLRVLPNPASDEYKFSYQTDKDIVAMKSTRFSDGLVYSVLQDKAGQRYLYGINLTGSKFTQESYHDNIKSPGFNTAVDYAFHSQYPFMFYGDKNILYAYDLGKNMVSQTLELDPQEKITLLKFNLFSNPNLKDLNDDKDFLRQQYQLIVASTTGKKDGGVVRFYDVDNKGKLVLLKEYKGFGDVVDITYRERRLR